MNRSISDKIFHKMGLDANGFPSYLFVIAKKSFGKLRIKAQNRFNLITKSSEVANPHHIRKIQF